jgi:hypothetical protein
MRCFMMVVNGFFTISQSLLSTLVGGNRTRQDEALRRETV